MVAVALLAGLACGCATPAAPTKSAVAPVSEAGDPPSAAVTDAAVASPTLSGVAASYQPLSPEECLGLEQAVAERLGVESTSSAEPFLDYLAQEVGTACEIRLAGTGEALGAVAGHPGLWGAADALRTMLTDMGWRYDPRYDVTAATGSGTGHVRDGALCLVMARWEPSPDADCPPTQPIESCQLTPAQRVYQIALACARRVGGQP